MSVPDRIIPLPSITKTNKDSTLNILDNKIVDIGTYTTDMLLSDKTDPIRELSSTVTIGIDALIKNITQECSHIRRNLTQSSIEKTLKTGYITKHRALHDITEIINKNKALIAKNIWSYVNSIWETKERR